MSGLRATSREKAGSFIVHNSSSKKTYQGRITLDMEVSHMCYERTLTTRMHIPTLFRNKVFWIWLVPRQWGGVGKYTEDCEMQRKLPLLRICFKGQNWYSTFCQSNSTPHDNFFCISVAIVFLFNDVLCCHVLVVVTLESVIYDVTRSSTSVLQFAWHLRQLDPWAARWLTDVSTNALGLVLCM